LQRHHGYFVGSGGAQYSFEAHSSSDAQTVGWAAHPVWHSVPGEPLLWQHFIAPGQSFVERHSNAKAQPAFES
jgi:hypothetical protein